MSEVLCVDGVWVAFDRGRDRVSVLEDVSFAVGAGEIVAVVGPRSQGKTTLIRVAAGMLSPDRGRVLFDGRDLGGLKDRELSEVWAGDVGVATRSGAEVRVQVREYVWLRLGARRWRLRWPWDWDGRKRRREQRLRVRGVLEQLGILGCAEMRWEELSNWERVLVELAQAVIARPRLLLVDDLVDGFGLREKQVMMDLLEDFASEFGCGVLMAVSDHASALRSVRVWQLARGRLTLMADHTHPDVIPLYPHRDEDVG
jgi:hemin transport system ATP-binding protein